MVEYWTEAQLAQFEAELTALNYPEWRADFYRDMRKQNCKTYREARARCRDTVKTCIVAPLRRFAEPDCPPDWLTPSGIKGMHAELCRKRREHSELIRAENARG